MSLTTFEMQVRVVLQTTFKLSGAALANVGTPTPAEAAVAGTTLPPQNCCLLLSIISRLTGRKAVRHSPTGTRHSGHVVHRSAQLLQHSWWPQGMNTHSISRSQQM